MNEGPADTAQVLNHGISLPESHQFFQKFWLGEKQRSILKKSSIYMFSTTLWDFQHIFHEPAVREVEF